MRYTLYFPLPVVSESAVLGAPLAFPDAFEPVGTVVADSVEAALAAAQNAGNGFWNPRHPTRGATPGDVFLDARGHATRVTRDGFENLGRCRALRVV